MVPLSPSNPVDRLQPHEHRSLGLLPLSFEPEPAERDGRRMRSDRKSRRGLTLRARKEFAMHVAPEQTRVGARVGEVLIAPRIYGCGLKVASYVVGDAAGKLKV